MTSYHVRNLVAVLVFCTGSLVSGTAVLTQRPAPSPAQEQHERTRRLSGLTMPDAARAAGEHYVRTIDIGTWAVAGSLESLTEFSDLVVAGEVVGGRSALTADQMYIDTTTTFRVTETIKGKVLANTDIKVVTVGGRLTFPDGTSAETKSPGFDGLRPGSRYLLFLQTIEKKTPEALLRQDTRGGYVPSLGPQGIFELNATGVKAQGRDIDPLKQQNDKTSVESFLARVRSAKTRAGTVK